MSKYRVVGKETLFHIWEVEAENEDEASDLAMELGFDCEEHFEGKGYWDFEPVEEMNPTPPDTRLRLADGRFFVATEDVVDDDTGEVIVEEGECFTSENVVELRERGMDDRLPAPAFPPFAADLTEGVLQAS